MGKLRYRVYLTQVEWRVKRDKVYLGNLIHVHKPPASQEDNWVVRLTIPPPIPPLQKQWGSPAKPRCTQGNLWCVYCQQACLNPFVFHETNNIVLQICISSRLFCLIRKMEKESVLKKKPYRLWVENAFCENWLKSLIFQEGKWLILGING